MRRLSLVKKSSPVLREKARRVSVFDTGLSSLVHQMVSVMANNGGVGLAAPQVGVSKQVITIVTQGMALVLVNPEITWSSEEKETQKEGCLSFPGQWFEVERPKFIEVSFQNVKGQRTRIKPPSPYVCRIIQHEVDHLNGILFTDRLKRLPTDGSELVLGESYLCVDGLGNTRYLQYAGEPLSVELIAQEMANVQKEAENT